MCEVKAGPEWNEGWRPLESDGCGLNYDCTPELIDSDMFQKKTDDDKLLVTSVSSMVIVW